MCEALNNSNYYFSYKSLLHRFIISPSNSATNIEKTFNSHLNQNSYKLFQNNKE